MQLIIQAYFELRWQKIKVKRFLTKNYPLLQYLLILIVIGTT